MRWGLLALVVLANLGCGDGENCATPRKASFLVASAPLALDAGLDAGPSNCYVADCPTQEEIDERCAHICGGGTCCSCSGGSCNLRIIECFGGCPVRQPDGGPVVCE